MTFLKRIEVWVLLAVIAAGLVWVFSSGSGDIDGEDGESENPMATSGSLTPASGPIQIYRSVVERDYGNARLDLEVRVRHEGSEKLVLQSPKVRLLTGSGREVPSFFLPFDAQPEVAPKSTQDVQLRYWLEKKDLAEALTLEVNGVSVPVKSATPLDLETLKSGEKKVFRAGEW